jgi:hypothetical protein
MHLPTTPEMHYFVTHECKVVKNSYFFTEQLRDIVTFIRRAVYKYFCLPNGTKYSRIIPSIQTAKFFLSANSVSLSFKNTYSK